MCINDEGIAEEQYITRTFFSYNISKVENRNPLVASSIEERVVLLHPFPNKAFVEIKLEGQVYIFKWDEALSEQFVAEELNRFVGKCKGRQEKVVEAMKSLFIPCA